MKNPEDKASCFINDPLSYSPSNVLLIRGCLPVMEPTLSDQCICKTLEIFARYSIL